MISCFFICIIDPDFLSLLFLYFGFMIMITFFLLTYYLYIDFVLLKYFLY